MIAYTRNMTDAATYWRAGSPSGFGDLDMSAVAPAVIACSWQDRQQLFRDSQAREVMSQAIVYADRKLDIGGYIAFGDLSADFDSNGFLDPKRVEGAREIRQVSNSPSLRGALNLTKVYL